MRWYLLIAVIVFGFGFTTLRGGTFKGGRFAKEPSQLPADSISYINGNPWTGIAGDYITEVN